MKFSGFWLLLAVLCASGAYAFEDLGPVDKARQDYPAIFIPDNVQTVRIGSRMFWAFTGQAEKFLDTESESELWQEATLGARAAFFAYMTKDRPGCEVSLSACSPLYRHKDGDSYLVVLGAPCDKVKVTKKVALGIEVKAPEKKEVAPVLSALDAHVPEEHKTATVANVVAGPQIIKVEEKVSESKAVESVKIVDAPKVAEAVKIAETQNVVKRTNDAVVAEAPQDSLSVRIAAYRELLSKGPENWRMSRRFGLLLCRSGELDEAAECLRIAARMAVSDKTSDAYDKVQCLLDAARANEKVGKLTIALKYYRMILHLDCSREARQESMDGVNRILMRNTDLLF